MKTLIALLCVAISGCATCKEHPVACTVVAVVAVGAVVASSQHSYSSSQPYIQRVQR